jgi:hypothetical protein
MDHDRAIKLKRFKWLVAGLMLLLAFLFWHELYRSTGPDPKFTRLRARVGAKIAELRNQKPRPVLLSGRLIGSGALIEALRGAQVVAAETTSGYASMADGDGRFTLPHLIWFPGATYTLFITASIYDVRCITVSAPITYPSDGIIDAGELQIDVGLEIPFRESPVRYIGYDTENSNYYRMLFEQLTATAETHHEKIDAVSKYVATRHNPLVSFRSARQILERGGRYCSDLAFAMAAIAAAGGYPTRTVHTSDTPQYLHTHVAVEVYYDYFWHIYDPTYGIFFLNRTGIVASYKELRLDPGLITLEGFRKVDPGIARSALEWMPQAYGSGLHQIYYASEEASADKCVSISSASPGVR